MKEIKLFDLEKKNHKYSSAYLRIFKEYLKSADYFKKYKNDITPLEENFSKITKSTYSISVNSGTSGLILAINSLKLPKQSLILLPAFSFKATLEAVLLTGNCPVFVDVNSDGLMNMEKASELILNQKQIKAVIPVHLYGNVCDMSILNNTIKENNLDIAVIEDCCQAHFSKYIDSNEYRHVGYNNLAVFSFYPSKNIGGWTDGGIITTSNKEQYDCIKYMRRHGLPEIDDKNKENLKRMCGNYKISSFQQDIINVEVEQIVNSNKNINLEKKEILYREYLKHLKNIKDIEVITLKEDKISSLQHFIIKCPNEDFRSKLIEYLKDSNIESRPYYDYILPDLIYETVRRQETYKNAINMAKTNLALPLHPFLSKNDIKLISANILNFIERIKIEK